MKNNCSNIKKTFYRRLLVAHLIDTGTNTVPMIITSTGMPKRTIQDTIMALGEIDIDCVFSGATKNGHYSIKNWGAINRDYIKTNLSIILNALDIDVI